MPINSLIFDQTFSEWTPERLKTLSQQFESGTPHDLIRWSAETFGADLVMATGFGPEGIVLLHVLAQVAPQTTVFYLDTDLLFPETYELRDKLEQSLGLRFTRVRSELSLNDQARRHEAELWAKHPDLCCRLRKVEPLRRYLSDKRAWITAIRRDQTTARANADLIEWDAANHLVKINPVAGWTSKQVWTYLLEHGLPYNPLHDRGYPSLGCWPCTHAVLPGADPRSGRWVGHNKTECGIHLQLPNESPAN